MYLGTEGSNVWWTYLIIVWANGHNLVGGNDNILFNNLSVCNGHVAILLKPENTNKPISKDLAYATYKKIK